MRFRMLLIAQLAALPLVAACGGAEAEPSGGSAIDGMQDGVVVRKDGEAIDAYIDRLYEAAKEEGKVVLYTPATEKEIEDYQIQWKKAFPEVELEIAGGTTDGILERALVEGQSGRTRNDVMQETMAEKRLLEDEGLLADYRPAHEEFTDPAILDTDYAGTPFFSLTLHVAYNTDLVDPGELPTDYEGFTEPRWRGKLAIDLNATEWVAGLIQAMGEKKTTELLRGLVANDIRLVQGTSNRTEQLANGEFEVMLDGYGHSLKEYIDKGSPMAVADPHPEPLTQMLGFMNVMKDAPHPNAARLFSEFILMDAGQQVPLNRNKLGARVASAENPSPYPDLFGGADPVPIGPEVDFDQARKMFEEIVVRKG
jgi:iron(III) transport system substrate-binding protein